MLKIFHLILEQDLFPDWTTKDEPESDHMMDFDNFDDFKDDQNDEGLVKKTCTFDKVKIVQCQYEIISKGFCSIKWHEEHFAIF